MTMPVGAGRIACFGYEDEPSTGGPAPNELACEGAREPLACVAASAYRDPSETSGPSHPSDGCTLTPDYYTVSGSAGFGGTAAVSATIDRYGHVFTSGGGGVGVGVGVAAHAGYLRDPDHPCDPPDESTLRSFLSGWAESAGGGAGLSVGVTHSSGMTGREIGITTPQLGATYTLGVEHGGS